MARPDTLQLAQWPLEAAPRVPHEYPHVVHVAQELGAGPWHFVSRVIAELDDMGFTQSLITIGNGEAEPVAARVARHHLPRVHGVLARRRLLARALDQITARSGPVTVHLHANGPGLPERLLLASLRGRAARLFTPHGTPLLNPRRRLVRTGHWLLEGAAGLLPITPVGRGVGEAQMLARAWGRAAFVLEHPVDDCYFAVEPQPEQPPVILGIGRLTRQKDFPTLLKAFALVAGECDCRLMILGEGRDRAALEDLLAEASQRAEQELERLGPPVATALGLLFGPLAPGRADDLTRRCVRNSLNGSVSYTMTSTPANVRTACRAHDQRDRTRVGHRGADAGFRSPQPGNGT